MLLRNYKHMDDLIEVIVIFVTVTIMLALIIVGIFFTWKTFACDSICMAERRYEWVETCMDRDLTQSECFRLLDVEDE